MLGSAASERPLGERPVVATIGVFDGLHLGHAGLLGELRARARARSATALVVSFDPHPIEVLAPTLPPHRLTTRRQKVALLAEAGVDFAWLIPFSRAVASLEPEAFLLSVVRRFALCELWIGADFRFGRGRRGDLALLTREGERHQFETRVFPPLQRDGRVVSSSWVRQLLAAGEVERAAELLGRAVLLEGRVGHGRGEGAKLLVATANLELESGLCLPGRGVYAGWTDLDGRLYPSAINVGRRPTLTNDATDTVEIHLIDWAGEIRGRRIGVHLGRRLREERRFSGLEELRRAVESDIQEARVWLADRTPLLGPQVDS